MTPPDDASLGFQEVQDRFNASAAALEQVRTKVQELADLGARQARATESLDEAAGQVAAFAASAQEATQTLIEAQAVVVEAFAALQGVMDGSELQTIREAVDGIDQRFADANQTMTSSLAELEARAEQREQASAGEIKALISGLSEIVSDTAAVAKERDEAVARANALQSERDAAVEKANEVQGHFDRLKAAAGARAVRKAGLEE